MNNRRPYGKPIAQDSPVFPGKRLLLRWAMVIDWIFRLGFVRIGDRVRHSLSGPEDHGASFGNVNSFAGTWIASHLCGASLDFEDVETTEFPALSLSQGLRDSGKNFIDNLGGLGLSRPGSLGYAE